MKRQLFLFILATAIVYLYAYDYQTFYSHRTCYFENNNKLITAMMIDSLKFDGDSVFYPMKQLRMKEDYCYDLNGAAWMGHTIIIAPAWNYFLNKNNDTIRIKTDAVVNESWILFQNNDLLITASVVTHTDEKILSTFDTVKTIKLEVWDRTMKPMPHFLHGKTLKLSKQYGFTCAFNLYEIPDISHSYTDRPHIEYQLAGMNNPQMGVTNFGWFDIFDFQPGDEFHIGINNSYGTAGPPTEIAGFIIQKILSRDDYADSIIYRVNEIYEQYYKYGGILESYTKTDKEINMRITANPVFDVLPGVVMHEERALKTTHIKQDGFIRKGYSEIEFNSQLNCFGAITNSDVCFFGSKEYYRSLGGPYFEINSCGFGIDSSTEIRKILYYKKGDTSWGTPHIINSLAPQTDITPRLHIFPNPAAENINVKGFAQQGKLTFKIINLQGAIVMNKPLSESKSSIDVFDLPKGLYFVSLHSHDSCIGSGRFMKK